MSEKVRVKSLERTCIACPSQWEGKTEDGRVIYIRYRHGYFSIGLGKTLDEAVWDDFYEAELDVGGGGWMTEDELREVTKDILELPDEVAGSYTREELDKVQEETVEFLDKLLTGAEYDEETQCYKISSEGAKKAKEWLEAREEKEKKSE